jgi:hypothetical protein
MPCAILPVSCITSSDYHCLSDSLSHMPLPSRSECENDFRINGGRADSCLDLTSDADPRYVGSLSSTPDLCGRTKLLHPRLRSTNCCGLLDHSQQMRHVFLLLHRCISRSVFESGLPLHWYVCCARFLIFNDMSEP